MGRASKAKRERRASLQETPLTRVKGRTTVAVETSPGVKKARELALLEITEAVRTAKIDNMEGVDSAIPSAIEAGVPLSQITDAVGRGFHARLEDLDKELVLGTRSPERG